MYVGAQVTYGSFFLNLAAEADFTDAQGSKLLSYGLILFTVGRFFGTALLSVISAPFLLGVYAIICTALTICIASLKNKNGVYLLMINMFFESIMYPVIFVLGTSGLGKHSRRASGLLVMGVAGGMVFPPIQGAIADAANTRISYWVGLPAFLEIAVFAFWQWHKAGRNFRAENAEIVLAAEVGETEGHSYQADVLEHGSSSDEKNNYTGGEEKHAELSYIERV